MPPTKRPRDETGAGHNKASAANSGLDDALTAMVSSLKLTSGKLERPLKGSIDDIFMHDVIGAPQCTTMNELMKERRVDKHYELFKEDVLISVWVTLDAEVKQVVHKKHASIDATLKKDLLLASLLTELQFLNCDTLSKYSKKLKKGEVPRDLRSALDQPLEDVVLRWICQVITEPFRKLKSCPPNRPLAYRAASAWFDHTATADAFEWRSARVSKEGKKQVMMVGRDAQMRAAMENIGSIVDSQKEMNPVVYIIAGPRQGKSLLLDCLAAEFDARGQASLTMTFNSGSPLSSDPISREQAMREFWGRLLGSLGDRVQGCTSGRCFAALEAYGVLAGVTPRLVSKAITSVFGNRRVMIGADEFSRLITVCKELEQEVRVGDAETHVSITSTIFENQWALVCSGFERSEMTVMKGISSRPVVPISLPPTLSEEVAPLRDAIWIGVRDSDDVIAYQCAKSVPGIMGAYLAEIEEAANNRHNSLPKLGKCMRELPFVDRISMHRQEVALLLIELWSESDATFDNSEGRSITAKLQAIGAAVNGETPEGYTTTFHPAVLYRLYYDEFLRDNRLAHIQGVYVAVNKLFAALKRIPFRTTSADGKAHTSLDNVSTTLAEWNQQKGRCIEAIITVALQIRASIPGKHGDVGSLVSSICGGYVTNPRTEAHDEALELKGGNAATPAAEDLRLLPTIDLDVFPGNEDREVAFPGSTTSGDADVQRLASLVDKHFAKSPLAVLTMAHNTNPGCDVALIGDLANGQRVLFLFEAKWFYANSIVTKDLVKAKVSNSLGGVSKIEGGLRISRVCIVLCVPIRATESPDCTDFDVKRLSRRMGVRSTVTLHTVGSDDAWRRLLLHTFHVLLPSDGDSKKSLV